jgi:hypothetical protein
VRRICIATSISESQKGDLSSLFADSVSSVVCKVSYGDPAIGERSRSIETADLLKRLLCRVWNYRIICWESHGNQHNHSFIGSKT